MTTIIIEREPVPPPQLTYRYDDFYAVCYGDMSGIIAICPQRHLADLVLRNLKDYQTCHELTPFVIKKIKRID